MKTRNWNRKNKLLQSLTNFINNVNFKSLNLSPPKQITLISCIIWYVSLFMDWIVNTDSKINLNSFHSLTWNIWFLLIIIFTLPIFVIFSTNYKEKIKLYSDLSLKNHFIIITSWFFILSFSVISLSFVKWLSMISDNYNFWSWVILSMTVWFFILFWWFFIRKEYYENSSEIILNRFNQNKDEAKEKDNMKLPF